MTNTNDTASANTHARPGRELAWRAMDKIIAHPEQHDQGVWIKTLFDDGGNSCGTAGCFAGHVVLLAGDRPIFDADRNPRTEYARSADTGRAVQIRNRAMKLLHIGESWAGTLFHSNNTIEELTRLVTEKFGPRPASPPAGHGIDIILEKVPGDVGDTLTVDIGGEKRVWTARRDDDGTMRWHEVTAP